MCGITGFWDRGPGPRRASHGHGWLAMTDTLAPPRSRRRRGLRRGRRRRGARLPPAGRRRPVRARAPAHGVARRALRPRLQRRDLQLHATCGGSSRPPGMRFRGSGGHRGPRGRRPALGARRRPARGATACSGWRCGTGASAGCTWRGTASGRSPCTTAGPARAFLFGSELKALRAHPAFDGDVDRDVAGAVLPPQLRARPVLDLPGHRQAPPGLDRSPSTPPRAPGTCPTPVPYWSLRDTAEAGVSDRLHASVDDATDELDADAARRRWALRMHADVALGAFLSGGIDSSLVVALMQAQHTLEGEDLHHRLRRRHLRRGRRCARRWPTIWAPSTTSCS